jgi:hypothetical protein
MHTLMLSLSKHEGNPLSFGRAQDEEWGRVPKNLTWTLTCHYRILACAGTSVFR